jgi:hypothetical protein
MEDLERWLLIGSAALALASMALIQFAGQDRRQGLRAEITVNRLAGIPFLLGLGLFPSLESQWVALGVLAVCATEVVADWKTARTADGAPADPALGEEEE